MYQCNTVLLKFVDEFKELCTIATPYALYKYNRLSMDLKCAPDIAKKCMEQFFRDLQKEVKVYIDNIGCFQIFGKKHVNII